MPIRINGIGTGYYGRSNVHKEFGTCSSCRWQGELQSYDTTLYFSFLFIPLIPLGKKRVLDSCPKCRRHKIISLKVWNEQKGSLLEESLAAYENNRGDTEAAKKLLAVIADFQDPGLLEKVAPLVKESLGGNPDVMAHLGSVYTLFKSYGEAEKCFILSLGAQDDPRVRQKLAYCLITERKPAEAQRYVQHILDRKKEDGFGLLLYLIEGYQAEGMHSEALDLMRHCEQVFPDLCKGRRFRKMTRLSEKYKDTRKSLSSKALASAALHPIPAKRGLPLWPKVLAPVLLVIAVFGYLTVAYGEGRDRTVYLVNGISHAYKATINGNAYTLPSLRAVSVEIPEGEVTIEVPDKSLEIPKQSCVIHTSFLTRPLSNPTFVINPDRVALLMWEEVEYTVKPQPGRLMPYEYHVGQLLYEFRDIDYPFQTFPKELSIEGNSAKRRGLSVVGDPKSALAGLRIAGAVLPPEDFLLYLHRYLTHDPSRDIYLFAYCRLAPPAEAIQLLRTRLDEKPILVEWHRMYQDLMGKEDPRYNLQAEYEQRLKADPENADLLYLLGRVARNNPEAYFDRATWAHPPSAYAFNALAFQRLAEGRFEDALRLSEEALKLAPENVTFRAVEDGALLALKRYAQLLDRNGEAIKKDEWNRELRAVRIRLLVSAGQPDKAREVIETYCGKLAGSTDARTVNEARSYLEAVLLYSEGKEKEFSDKAADVPALAFQAALASGNLEQAMQDLEAAEHPAWSDYLTLYVAAAAANARDVADKSLAAAVEILGTGDRYERLVASILYSRQGSFDTLETLPVYPEEKRVILAAAGIRIPQWKENAFSLGKKLNDSPAPPHILLKRVFGP